MQSFKNNFRYGQTSESFAQSMLKGELRALKEQSLKKCINGDPIGYEGIKQRTGYQFNSLITINDNFVQFPLILSKNECQILIFSNQILINLPDSSKYFRTPLSLNDRYDINTIQDVATDSQNLLFIASSKGIDVFQIKDNFQNTVIGGNILTKVNTAGLDSANLLSVNTNVYFFYQNRSIFPTNNNWQYTTGGQLASLINPYTYVGANNILQDTFFNQLQTDYFVTKLYIEAAPGLNLGDIVSFSANIPAPIQRNVQYKGKIASAVQGYKFTSNGITKIYPGTLPPTIQTNNFNGTPYPIYNIPSTVTSVQLYTLSDITEGQTLITNYLPPDTTPVNGVLESGYFVRGVKVPTDASYLDSICFPTINTTIYNTSTQGKISGNGFCMYLNTDNRLYVGYDNVVKASEVGNLTNFVIPTSDTTNGDVMTALTPLSLGFKGVSQIKWIWELRDRGTLFGTNVGLKLLNYGSNSFRSGISHISDLVPSSVRPISVTINQIGGVAFVNNERNKILFLASESTLRTPAEDLTRYVDFFLDDKIIKIVSIPFISGEMTMVLTESGKVYRLITGNNDKFGWSQDQFYTQDNYNLFEELPKEGEYRIWYKVKYQNTENLINGIESNIYYTWNGFNYIETVFNPITVYDISVYKNQLVIIFNINNLPDVPPVKVISIMDLNQKTTVDLYTFVPPLDYIFTQPENIIIGQGVLFPVYYPNNINQSFLDAIIQPSRMFLETHYDEYVNKGRSSKMINREICYRITNGQNLYNVKLGYKQNDVNIVGQEEWFEQTDNTILIKREDNNLNPVAINGNVQVDNSSKAELVTCFIQSDNLIPTIIKSEEYQIKFT